MTGGRKEAGRRGRRKGPVNCCNLETRIDGSGARKSGGNNAPSEWTELRGHGSQETLTLLASFSYWDAQPKL